MGIFCSIWGCSDEPRDFWGDKAEYVLFKCRRCGNETILCSKENRMFGNDEEGRKIRDLMISDAEFSRQCIIHDEFVKAEGENVMNLTKREKALNAIREKYGLAPGFRQPDPVILWQKGLWKPKPSKKDGESRAKKAKPKPKGKSGENKPDLDDRLKVEFRISKSNSDRENETVEWTDLSEAEPKTELSVEAQVDRLERRMEKHVAREEYEKAAKLRDQIVRLKNK
jgi:hypothetical protein